MTTIEALVIGMMNRVCQFGEDNPIDPPNLKATEYYTSLNGILATAEEYGGSQDFNTGRMRGTTEEKEMAADALRKVMSRLARIAKILDTAIYPTVAYEMRLSGIKSYQGLLERGRAFVTALEGREAVFIEHGAAATVAADLAAAVAGLGSAVDHKNTAHSNRVGSTAGLRAITREGLRIRRKLDAILSAVYEEDPAKLAAWNAIKRVHKDGVTAEPDEDGGSTPPSGTGSTTPA